MEELTLTILKPDAIQNNLIGKIISIFENNNLSIEQIIVKKLSKDEIINLYKEHVKHVLFTDLVNFMLSSNVCIIVWKGDNAISKVRHLIGNTNPKKAKKHTIRYIYGTSYLQNIIHSSDSKDSAKREINIFFDK